MPNNIEAFVKTLESEGVDAGRKAAQKIEEDARDQAGKIIAEGKLKAEQIVNQANSEAEKIKARMNSSLELAARDAILMLRQKLTEQLKNLLEVSVNKTLREEDTLAKVLREVIPAYAKADAAERQNAQISISSDMKSRLLESTLRELQNSLKQKNVDIDVKYNLAKSGFEFKVEGSTVEVGTESVTALLAEMIDPDLREFLEKASENVK